MSKKSDELVENRKKLYGNPIDSAIRIAQVWSGILDHDINAHEVALMMMGLKLVRTQISPQYADNSDDIEGYLEIFRQIMGIDMINAQSAEEYLRRIARNDT